MVHVKRLESCTVSRVAAELCTGLDTPCPNTHHNSESGMPSPPPPFPSSSTSPTGVRSSSLTKRKHHVVAELPDLCLVLMTMLAVTQKMVWNSWMSRHQNHHNKPSIRTQLVQLIWTDLAYVRSIVLFGHLVCLIIILPW